MKKQLIRILVLFIIFLAAPSFADASMDVWVDTGTVKVRQQGDYTGTGQQAARNITLKVAKNEFEPFQIFIHAGGEDLSDVDISVSNLSDGNGHTIISDQTSGNPSNIYIYKEGYMQVTKTLRSDYQLGQFPDPLLPKKDIYYNEVRNTFPFSVTNGNVQGVWVDIGTIASTPAGIYTGTYTVTAAGKEPIIGNITLQVWDFALPSTATLKTIWGFEDSNVDRGFYGYNPTSISSVAVNNAGSGYSVGDTVTILVKTAGGVVTNSSGKAVVSSVDANGAVTGISVKYLYNGISYSAGTGLETSGGSGAGLTVNITTFGYVSFGGSYSAWQNWVANRVNLLQKAYLYNRISLNAKGGGATWFTTIGSDGSVSGFNGNWATAYANMQDGTAIPSGTYAGAKKSVQLIEMGHTTGSAYDTNDAKWTNMLQSWWNYFNDPARNWDPKRRLYAYGHDEPHGYIIAYRGGSVVDYSVNYAKALSMYNVNTGAQGRWTNTLGNSSRDVLDALLKASLVDPVPSFDVIGTWSPVSIRYEWATNRFNDSAYQIRRDSYPDLADWPNRDHFWYFADNVDSVNIPNMDISTESPAQWARVIPWLSWTYRNTGLLYYNASYFWRLGFEPFVNTFQQNNNGQDTQIYPGVASKAGRTALPEGTPEIGGTHDIPIESVKLKVLREGMEDYEYMELLRKQGQTAAVDQIVDTLYNPTPWPLGHGKYFSVSTDVTKYFTAREALANLIVVADAMPPSVPSGLRVD